MKLIIAGILVSFNAIASYLPQPTSQDQPWSITASAGNGTYQKVPSTENNTALGRLALANEMMLAGNIGLGFELGLQTGHRMRLDLAEETLNVIKKWIPLNTTLGPSLDLLITAKSDPLGNTDFFALLKGGFAYRRWQAEYTAPNSISQLSGEIQAGFGYPMNALASLNLLYQGIFSNDGPSFNIDQYTSNSQFSSIPTLHAFLVGLSLNI